jgi:hypothetical protein
MLLTSLAAIAAFGDDLSANPECTQKNKITSELHCPQQKITKTNGRHDKKRKTKSVFTRTDT